MTLSEKITQLCEERGITRNKFEVESGVGRGQTARWDKNRPSGDKLQKAADYFGVDVSYLLNDEQTEKPVISDELAEYLELLRDRPETRALLHVGRGMTKEQIEQMANFMMAMRGGSDGEAD